MGHSYFNRAHTLALLVWPLLSLPVLLSPSGCAAPISDPAANPSGIASPSPADPASNRDEEPPAELETSSDHDVTVRIARPGDAPLDSEALDGEGMETIAPSLIGELDIRYPARISAIDRRPPSSIRTSSVRVVLQVLVDVRGRAQHISIRSSDRPGSPFENSAIESIRKARFTPGTRDGEPTAAWALVQIAFPTP